MSRSYSQRHLRFSPDPSRMADASVSPYINKISEALIVSQGNSDRINSIQHQLNTAEEKIINLSRLINIHGTHPQSLSFLESIEKRLAFLESSSEPQSSNKIPSGVMDQVNKALKQTEDRIASLLQKQHNPQVEDIKTTIFELLGEKEKVLKEAVEHAWLAEKTCSKLAEDNLNRIFECEKAIQQFKQENFDLDKIEEEVSEKVKNKLEKLLEVFSTMVEAHEDLKGRVDLIEEHERNKENLLKDKDREREKEREELKKTRSFSYESSPHNLPDQQTLKGENLKMKDKRKKVEKLYQKFPKK